jgi:hypothetical protein
MDDDFPIKDRNHEHMKNFVCKNIDNLKNCDCRACTNPRKFYSGKKIDELTIQERRKMQDDE